jgi:hypothetical protein
MTRSAVPFTWRDESVPAELAEVLQPHREVDAVAFTAWLGPQLGDYREHAASSAGDVTAEDERAYLLQLEAAAAGLRELLRATAAGPRATARLHEAGKALRIGWRPLRDAQRAPLKVIERLARAAWADMRPGRAGRPSATARDRLVAAVVDRLREHGITKSEAALQLAGEVLRACGVPAPAASPKDRNRSARRALAKGRPQEPAPSQA